MAATHLTHFGGRLMSVEIHYDRDKQEVVIIEYADLLIGIPESVCRRAIKAGLDVVRDATIVSDQSSAPI